MGAREKMWSMRLCWRKVVPAGARESETTQGVEGWWWWCLREVVEVSYAAAGRRGTS